ncbi:MULTISPECIES: type II toxin-antitoxin system Phd/YefM family antitoxin [unclassified Mesotoga]|uniref:type II toxin-antitoxin system Phd/YefM family antitoxin n=1 Tax=unclassified Mesotoga TaxID=1184398 RepID=UPI000B109FF3|nr:MULTISPECIES: toxin-antitoxin (TA) system antitoxin [unclassified Mesotoga]PNQ05531.1 toxin-antitoxin (TA) system antitoxin [Mesotoga sp. SC_NapDC3]PXF34436.1 toxin-antitoxin (TA) system antitoxin [Mesotoga sp. SC_NapDC]
MKTVNVRDVRNRFSEIVDGKEELLILRRGVPVMKISPVSKEDLMNYYLSKAQEEARKIGLSEEEGLEVLDEVRREMKDEGRH